MEGTIADYFEFPTAGYAAFEELQSHPGSLVYVIPSSNGMGWRIARKIQKTALRSKDKLDWVALWEAVCKERSHAGRQDVFHRALRNLIKEHNQTAVRAQTEIDLDLQRKKRSPGFEEGAVLFHAFSSELPVLRG